MTEPQIVSILHGGPSMDEREERLVEMADASATRRRSFVMSEHFVLTVAAALMALGVGMIVLGWLGASDSIIVEEQVPYLISGGQLGTALAIIGAQCLFVHWLTVSIREARADRAARKAEHEQLMQQLVALTEAISRSERPIRRASRRD